MTDIEVAYETLVKLMKAKEYEDAYKVLENIYLGNLGLKKAYEIVVGWRVGVKKLVEAKAAYSDLLVELLHKSYVMTGREKFDDFMTAIEWNREPEQRFWLVRREQLLPVCKELQDLVDGDTDELFLSMPPRVGKTTIVMFFLIWYMCRFPEKSNLYSSFTEKVVKTFFNGVLEVLNDDTTYRVRDVFPGLVVASTDSKDLTLNIGRRKRYANLTSRSVDGSLNGSCDAEGILIADDLHSGIDEARSKDQLIKKWETVRANLLSRKKGDAKILWIGTRWSLIDCISNRIEMLESDRDCAFIRYKVFNVPALNEKGESNFDYMFHKGYTTADFKAIRASYEIKGDQALWLAPYMGTPIERDGAVFSPDELRYYNGELPMDADHSVLEPDRKYIVVDPAWGGGDFVAGVVVFQYGNDLFVPSVVYSNGDKGVTQPLIVHEVEKYGLTAMFCESTRVTMSYATEVDDRLKENGIRINVNGNVKNWNGQQGKQQRIYDKAPEIRERFVFLDKTKWNKVYTQFMQNVFSFVVEGKNKHDDAPDVLAMTLVNASRTTPKAMVISASRLDQF